MMNMRIAIVDDEVPVCRELERVLSAEDFDTESFTTGKPFIERMANFPFQIVFLDLRLPDMNGIDILSKVKAAAENTEVIVITGHGSIESAVEAMKKAHTIIYQNHFASMMFFPWRAPSKKKLNSSTKIKTCVRNWQTMIIFPDSSVQAHLCRPYLQR